MRAATAGTGTFTVTGQPATSSASGGPLGAIIGYYVLYDTVSRAPFITYAFSQYFPGGDPTVGLTVTGLTNGGTYYAAITAWDGTNQSAPSFEVSKTV